ncbi:MAG: MotA/TolQ/ExbB proton channel family protein [Bacteroidetes bacterium]|nr:MotA/TolQ/ExbB proton channel family protein [Bacteroidota bacterium]
MEQITNILYWLTTGLLVPVIVFLLFFFAKSLIMIGGFYGAYISRTKVNMKLNKTIEEMPVDEFLKSIDSYKQNKSQIITFLNKLRNNSDKYIMLDKIFGDYEIVADKALGQSKLLVKIGPMLGLMGTLIPMGPALVGLATGDVASMASNMQVAFATTVVGIIIGAIGFITLQIKQRWVADDMNIMEYVVESLKQK